MHESTYENVTEACNKNEAPGRRIQGQQKTLKAREGHQTTICAERQEKCPTCDYFRQVSNAGRNRVCCCFTGEKLPPLMTCDFWALVGGAV